MIHPQRQDVEAPRPRELDPSQLGRPNEHSRTPFNVQKWSVGKTEEGKVKRNLTLKAKIIIAAAVIVVMLTATVLMVVFIPAWSRGDSWLPDCVSDSELGRYASAAVSTDAAPCAEIGRDILKKKGSAVDAAIAVLVCMGVYNPQSSGLGGGFLMVYYNRSQEKAYYIDARETAPKKANATMFEGDAKKAKLGGLSIATPSELAGFHMIHKKFGSLPWKELFPPTVRLCRKGFPVGHHLGKSLKKMEATLIHFQHISNVFINNKTGRVYETGDVIQRPDLAKTLEAIADLGVSALYGPSEMAAEFLRDLKEAGSIIDASDLQGYRARIRVPISVQLRGDFTLHTVSPPGSGALLAFMLNVLSGYEDMIARVSRTKKASVLTLHRLVETFRFAYARRMEMEDSDSKEMQEFLSTLTSSGYANKIRRLIDDERTYDDPGHYGLKIKIKEDHGTADLAIVAPNGDAVSVTSTINLYFGSMVMSKSTGIILNDEMDDFSSPNITNEFGIPPSPYNLVVPGKRPLSSMSPAVVVDAHGNVRLVLGANGGTQITSSVAQVALRNLWLDNDIKRSIDAPRLHDQLLPNNIVYEDNFPQDMLSELRKLGHRTRPTNGSMIGIVMGIARGKDGTLYANSDYRKAGRVAGF